MVWVYQICVILSEKKNATMCYDQTIILFTPSGKACNHAKPYFSLDMDIWEWLHTWNWRKLGIWWVHRQKAMLHWKMQLNEYNRQTLKILVLSKAVLLTHHLIDTDAFRMKPCSANTRLCKARKFNQGTGKGPFNLSACCVKLLLDYKSMQTYQLYKNYVISDHMWGPIEKLINKPV